MSADWVRGRAFEGTIRAVAVRYLFDSAGDWIAFQEGDLVFDRSGAFLGWTPWTGEAANDVVTGPGEYLGTIVPESPRRGRLYTLLRRRYHGYPGHPVSLRSPGYPGHPGSLPPAPLPAGARDVSSLSSAVPRR